MQKLDKPVELEGRVIQYKPIAKRNNQVGDALKVGDHVRTLHKKTIDLLKEFKKENKWIVTKIYPMNFRDDFIEITHLGDGLIHKYRIRTVNSKNVEKIDSNSTPAASAASAASTASAAPISNQKSPNFFEQLAQHRNTNANNLENWNVLRKPRKPKNKFVMVESSNNNSPVLL